ncbi:hypothetical protein niasHT_005844 [Heterodera trifolii]|uniref:Uncharacterized protein n=1 Tax=Heterodera trifolii TaxID=157864 RepID=A0ABD2LT44_9BILA
MSSGWKFVLYFLLLLAPIANAKIFIDSNDKPSAIELNVIVDDRTPTLKAKSDDKPAKIHVYNEQQKHERGIQTLPLLFNKNCELDDLICRLRESRRKTREQDEKLVKTLRDVLAKNSRTKKQKAARLMDMDDEDECPFPLCNVRANKKSSKTLKDELNNKNIQSEQRTLLDSANIMDDDECPFPLCNARANTQQFGPNLPIITSFKPGKADLDTMFRRMLTKTYTKQQKQQMAKIVKEIVDKKQMKQEHGIGKYQMHGDKLTDDEHQQQRALPNDADLLRKKVAAAGGENDSSKVPIVLIGHLDPEQTKALTKAGIPIGLEKLA